VYTYHTQLEQYAHYVPLDAKAIRKAASSLTRTYANAADAVVVPTAAMGDRLRELGVRSRIEVAPTGIDLDAFAGGRRRSEVRASLGAVADEPLALTVCRLGREKNIELMIDALAVGDSSVRLAVVGEGPSRAELERHAVRRGVFDRVRFVGYLDRAALPDVYASADAFLFSSVTETQGIVLAEALAAGCRIIAVDTPQTSEVLGSAATYVTNEAASMARALSSLIATPSAEMRERSREAARRFGRDLQIERIVGLYGDLLARQPMRSA